MGVRLEYKTAAEVAPAPVAADVGPDEGIVLAIVGVTGVQDLVDDVVLPGAYTKTLAERRPKVCWAHSWEDPVGRVLHIEEVPPGDPRLPTQTKDGKPWPKAAGALVATMQFNLESQRGQEAWAAVKFFSKSGECCWSIGYQVPPGASTKRGDGVRMIKSLDLYELSFVLHGAAAETMTLDLKSAVALMEERGGAPGPDGDPFAVVLGAPAGATGEPDEDAWAEIDGLAADDDEHDRDDDTDHPVDEAKILGSPDWAPEVKRSFTAEQRREMAKRGHALPDGSFPIASRQDVVNAVRAHGRAAPGDRPKVKAHIMRRARALGCADALPDDWKAKSKALDAVLALEGKYDTSPVGTPGGRQNWVDKVGGLPPFIRAVAHALIRGGHDESRAIQLAVAAVRRWAQGRGKVTAKTRAKAVAALARWEAMKAGKSVEGWDPALEVGPHAGYLPPGLDGKDSPPVDAKGYPGVPRLAGTWEERSDALRDAVENLLVTHAEPNDDGYRQPDCWVSTVGTYDDRVIVHVEGRGDTADGDGDRTLEIPYTWSVDGTPVLGTPQEVQLQVTVADGPGPDDEPDDGEDGGAGDGMDGMDGMDGVDATTLVLPMILDAAFAAKALTGRFQSKAGRVLSGTNADRIAAAVRSLISVLQAAGVSLDTPPPAAPAGPQEDAMAAKALDAQPDDDSVIDADDLARWAALADAARAL